MLRTNTGVSVMRLYVGGFSAVLAMAVSGCTCQTPTDECNDISVVFASPASGATVNPTLDVEVRANTSAGTAVAISGATIAVKGPGQASFGAEQDATLRFTRAVISGLSLMPGDNELRATVTTSDPVCGGKTATVKVTARAQAVTPKVTAVAYPQDANGDGTLNGTELPVGTNLQMRVTATDVTSAITVRALNGTMAVSTADAEFTGGVATLSIPVLSNSGTFDLFAQLISGGSAVNTAAENPLALSSIKVNRAVPTCAITTADVVGVNDDSTPSSATFGLRATGGLGMAAVSATFQLDTAVPVPATPTSGAVAVDFAVPRGGDTNYTLKLTATDAVGNTCTATKNVRVDLMAPVVSLSIPPSADGGMSFISTTPVAVTISATGAADGNGVCLYRQKGTAPRQTVGCGVLANGSATIAASFSDDGQYSLIGEVEDAAGNVGTATKVVTVSLSVCGLQFDTISVGGTTTALQCPAFITRLGNGGQIGVRLATSSACAGVNAITLFHDNIEVATNTTGSFTVSTSNGMHTLRGSVVNNPGEPPTTVSCALNVDTNAVPVFTSPGLAPSPYPINASEDLQPATAGAQRPLAFTANVPTMGRVELCANTNSAAIVGASAAPCSDGATGWFVYQTKSDITSPIAAFTFAEGTYDLRLVLVVPGGGATPSAVDLKLNVDVTTPCLSAGGVTLPQDANNDGRLNLVELNGAPPRVAFSIDPACGTASTAQIIAAVGATTYSAVVSSPSGAQTVDLTGLAATADIDMYVRLADAIGNATTPSSAGVRKALSVDREAPTCTLAAPSVSQTLNLIDVPSGMLTVSVQTSSDVASVPVALGTGAPVTASVAPVTFVASPPAFTISGTGSQAITATCTDTAGNATPLTATVTYDLEAPTCRFAEPTMGQNFTTNSIDVSVIVTGADDQRVQISASAQPGVLAQPMVMTGTASATIANFPNGLGQTLTAVVRDVAGNVCTATVSGVNVSSTNCNLVTNGFINSGGSLWVNAAMATGTGSTRTADIVATSSNCPMRTVTVARASPMPAALGTVSTNSSGVATFAALSFTEGDVISVTVDNGAGGFTSASLTVDFSPPAVGSVNINGAVAPASALFFVAPGTGVNAQNRQVQLGTAGYYPDADGASGAQLTMAIDTVTGGAVDSSAPGSVQVLFKGAPVLTRSITSSNQSYASLAVTLPHDDSGAFVVRVTDRANNSSDAYAQTATIDVIAPAKPTVARALTSARAATASLTWQAVGDDGATGTVRDYDVRWSTSSVAGNNAMATEADYFGTATNRDSASAAAAGTIVRTLTLPPINTYYLTVRARDEVDNYSPYEAPTALDNLWTRTSFVGDTAAFEGSGWVVNSNSNLNNESLNDLAISQVFGGFGAAYVVYGSTTLAGQTLTPAGCVAPACTRFAPTDTAAYPDQIFYGWDLSADGNIGDASNEGKNDLVVTQQLFPDSVASLGRVFIYFGVNAATISPSSFIEIRGTATSHIGYAGRIIKDMDGDGLSELAISAPLYSPPGQTNLGRLYIFKGRTVAAWQAARTSTDPTTMAPFIPVTSADWAIDGPQANEHFGDARFGIVSLGDLNSDGKSELAVGQGDSSVNKVALYASTAAAPTPLQTLSLSVVGSNTGQGSDGFGGSMLAGFNFMNATANDLVATYQGANGGNQGEVYIFADLGATGAPATPSFTITGNVYFGSSMAAGSINGSDATTDLFIGEGNFTNTNAWLLWNQAGVFPSVVQPSSRNFWVSRFNGNAIAGTTDNSLSSVGFGNLTGSGNDVVLADVANNVVYVWR